jgi:hypothetical protein
VPVPGEDRRRHGQWRDRQGGGKLSCRAELRDTPPDQGRWSAERCRTACAPTGLGSARKPHAAGGATAPDVVAILPGHAGIPLGASPERPGTLPRPEQSLH